MATFTITTAQNIEALAGKTGSDVYNINGGYLTVDMHSRYGVNQNTSAAMGNIVMSASLGGTIEFNSTLIRLIRFNTGSGLVPAINTLITQGSASGRILGVYSSLTTAPVTAGSAMPAAGFVLIRQWNSVAYASGSLTGITATSTGTDRPGWMEIVGVDALTATVNRLNLFKVQGDYFDFLGVTTDGVRTTGYQIPSNGSLVYCPGVEVETAVGSNTYEFYPCAGTIAALVTNIATDAVRGKVCWISTTGLVRFGSDGTNSTGGFVPSTGCKIRVANIFFTCCTAAAPTVNVIPNVTLATRYEFATTGGGVVDIDKASVNWYLNFSQAFSIRLRNSSTFTSVVLSECASPIRWENFSVGQEAANSQVSLTMNLNFAGGTMNRCTWSRANLAGSGNYVCTWSDISGFVVNNERLFSFVKAGNTNCGSNILTRVSSSNWTNTVVGGGRLALGTCTDVTFTSTTYYDHPAIITTSAVPFYAFDLSAACARCTIDGLSFGGLVGAQPYNGLLAINAAGCFDIKLRNIGTAATPLNLGRDSVDATWTQATTTATATTALPHLLRAGDIVNVLISSNTGIIAVGQKSVIAAPTATTFTFTCITGALTGTLTYYPVISAYIAVLAGGAAANKVSIQRVFTKNTRTGVLTGDNSSKNITLEQVWGDPFNALNVPELNAVCRGIVTSPALTAQTACYGTHWFDFYTMGVPININSVAWTRSGAVATITSSSHEMFSGKFIIINTSSDLTAITRGQKTVTVLTSNTFSIPCLNAGALSGTLSFVPCDGRVALQMNEATAETASQVLLSNGAAFTSSGSIYMPEINHQVDFTSPSKIKGHASFPIIPANLAGGVITNHDLTYSLDNGVTYKNLSYPRSGASGVISASTFTVTNAVGVNIGDYVFGTGIAPNAKVTAIASNTITVDLVNTATVSGIVTFNQLPNEIVDSIVGFDCRVRIKTTTANTLAISSVSFFTTSTVASRAAQYPLDSNTVNFTGIKIGSDVVILQAGTTNILSQADSISGTSYSFTYSGAQSIDVGFLKNGLVPLYIRNLSLGLTNSSLPVSQVPDRAFI